MITKLENLTNLQLRTISAVVLIPIVFGALILGGWPFKIFILLAFGLSLYEWVKLSEATDKPIQFAAFGFVYLVVCFYEFYHLRAHFESGLYLVLTMLLVVWASDTGAYFIGRKYGEHKMAPAISPNKSWEGMAGAIGAAGLTLLILITLARDLGWLVPNSIPRPTLLSSLALLIAGGALGYVGQMGDLVESFLKRKAGAKDSGRLIPGHGGLLDRVDSILLVSPFFVLLAFYVF